MGSAVFERPGPHRVGSSVRQKFVHALRWCIASAAVVLALAGCGGGGGGDPALPTAAAPVRLEQIEALTLAQQSANGRLAMPRAGALAAVSQGTATEDFEAGMSRWSDWGNAQVVAGAGTSGSSAMQVGTGAGGAGLTVAGMVPGTAYRLTAQVKVTDPSDPVVIGVNMLSSSGEQVIGQSSPLVTSTGYVTVTVDLVAPADAASAVVWIWKNAGSGHGLLDDVSFGPATGAPPPPPPSGSNLVSNGGFESGMTGWDNWGNASVSDQANSGTSALSVGTAAGGTGQSVGGITAGTVYRLVAQAKVSDPSETVFVGVNLLNQAGAAVAQMALPVSSTTYNTLTFDITAPADAVNAVVYVWKNAGSGLGFVDDFAFGPASASTPPPTAPASVNLVLNGDFQQGLSSWVNWGNTVVATTAAKAQVGTGSGGIGQSIPGIAGGKTYRLSAQVNMSAFTGEPGYLALKFLDAAGNSVQDRTVSFTAPGVSSTQIRTVAPANATSALVFVWKNAGSSFAFVDDVVLVELPALQASPAPTVQLSGRSTMVQLDAIAGAFGSLGGARLTGGDAIFAWSRSGDPANLNGGILCYSARLRFTATSGAFGDSACLPGAFVAPQRPTQVLARPNNHFIIAWLGSSGPQYQLFDGFVRPVGSIQNGSPPEGDIALTGGGYVSLVTLGSPCTLGCQIMFQRRSSDGTPSGPVTPVGDTNGTDAQIVPLAGGGFAVAWSELAPQSAGFPASVPVVVSRMFNADGTAVGGPMVVAGGAAPVCNPRWCPYEILQSVAPMDDGGYLVAWTSGPAPDGTVEGTFVRRFRADGTPGPAVGKLDGGPRIFRTTRLDRLAIAASGPDGFLAVWPGTGSVSVLTPHVFDATSLR